MAAPYVSIKRLVDNSLSAMLAAVEVYNKPRMTYRDEVTVVLAINAWELALKAALRQGRVSIFYPKRRGKRYRSISIDEAIGKMTSSKLWPTGVDGTAATANIKVLITYRDLAIHLYNARELGAVIHPFLQQNVINYRDFMLARFNKDLAESMTWQLLPLGATAPADAVQFMRVDRKATMVAEVEDFMNDLRALMDRAAAEGGDMGRLAVVYDINLRALKKVTSGDLVVAVSPTADGRIVLRKTDPNETHPYNMKILLERVNARRSGRKLTTRDFAALCWKEALRENQKFAWKHNKGASHVWSGDAVSYLASLTDERYQEVRAQYGAYLKSRRDPQTKSSADT